MRKRIFNCALTLCFACMMLPQVTGSAVHGKKDLDWLKKWFVAWELVSREHFALSPEPAPLMVFFDKQYVYTTSATSAPGGELFPGPGLLEEKLSWSKAAHNGKLLLPDGQELKPGLMSFAAPLTGKHSSFFVMAAPAIWEEAGISSKELGLERLMTGVFLHEFAHTRQMQGIGKKVDQFEKQYKFDMPLTDDIVQDHFKSDSAYVQSFREEVNSFYAAAFAKGANELRSHAEKGLELLAKRQANFSAENKTVLRELDNLFLTMEGLGQYAAVAWLIHPKGAALTFDEAIKGFRRKGNQWSQEEGLALFLVLTRLGKVDWQKDIFGKNPKTVVELLQEALEKN